MSEISLSKIEKSFGARKIHDKISLDISKTDRIGCLYQVSAFPDLYLVKDVLEEPFAGILKLQANLNLMQNKIAGSTGDEQKILLQRYGALEHQQLTDYEVYKNKINFDREKLQSVATIKKTTSNRLLFEAVLKLPAKPDKNGSYLYAVHTNLSIRHYE